MAAHTYGKSSFHSFTYMKANRKFIGINQRIPFEVIDSAIYDFLNTGKVHQDKILSHMLEYTKGQNRAEKASMYIFQVLKRQSRIVEEVRRALGQNGYHNLNQTDRKVLVLCLIGLTYPITYDLLVALAQGFKVQDTINKKFISQKVMSIYGSNRTVDIAIDALLPMIIELNTIQRVKVSIYSKFGRQPISNPLIRELVVYTDIKLSGSKSILLSDLNYRPWLQYFEPIEEHDVIFGRLIAIKESAVGRGYLSARTL
jgi:transcription termination factor NusB